MGRKESLSLTKVDIQHSESGFNLVLLALGLAAILSVVAMAIDIGWLQVLKRYAQQSADAAALACAQRFNLEEIDTLKNEIAVQTVNANLEQAGVDLSTVSISTTVNDEDAPSRITVEVSISRDRLFYVGIGDRTNTVVAAGTAEKVNAFVSIAFPVNRFSCQGCTCVPAIHGDCPWDVCFDSNLDSNCPGVSGMKGSVKALVDAIHSDSQLGIVHYNDRTTGHAEETYPMDVMTDTNKNAAKAAVDALDWGSVGAHIGQAIDLARAQIEANSTNPSDTRMIILIGNMLPDLVDGLVTNTCPIDQASTKTPWLDAIDAADAARAANITVHTVYVGIPNSFESSERWEPDPNNIPWSFWNSPASLPVDYVPPPQWANFYDVDPDDGNVKGRVEWNCSHVLYKCLLPSIDFAMNDPWQYYRPWDFTVYQVGAGCCGHWIRQKEFFFSRMANDQDYMVANPIINSHPDAATWIAANGPIPPQPDFPCTATRASLENDLRGNFFSTPDPIDLTPILLTIDGATVAITE